MMEVRYYYCGFSSSSFDFVAVADNIMNTEWIVVTVAEAAVVTYE
jgi:hypothetical protein